jgi:glycosyltransferase involved in cell wall biosynthesis
MPDDILELICKYNIKEYYANEVTISDLFKANKFDKLYSPLWSNSYFELFKLNVPIMLTQHGLRAIEMNRDIFEYKYASGMKDYMKAFLKQTFLYRSLQRKYFNQFKRILEYENLRIITVSNHSKYSMLYYFPFLSEDNIRVLYSPNHSLDFNETESVDTIILENPYYLVVSGNRWIKNAYRTLKAFDRLFSSRPDFHYSILVVGLKSDNRILRNLKNRDMFHTIGYVNRSELESLYSRAYALIYPSLNEGFGYPPIEAMKYGVPVITSSFSAIYEVCGDAPLYVNPYSIDEIAIRALELTNKDLYERKRNASLLRFKYILGKQNEDLQILTDLIAEFGELKISSSLE